MKKTKYQGISLPVDYIEKIKQIVEDDWRYSSISAFIRAAIVEKIKDDYGYEPL